MTTHELEPIARPHAGLVSVDGRVYPLESVRVAGRAEGGIALTTITQRFANPHAEALEVVYAMPLPADGAVLAYTIRIGEKVIRGEVQPRERAEAAYREALYQGRTAGLLEQDRADTFQQRLGNVPPCMAVEAEIEVLHPLAFLAGVDAGAPQWEYRFPTVVGVRYEGVPGRVPDAGRLDVDRDASGGIPTRVELQLAVADLPDGDDVVSPSHGLRLEPGPEGTVARFAEGQRLDRDIVLRWRAATGEVGLRVLEGRGLEGDDGRYALVTLVPPAVPGATFRRDLTVLLDASGSMAGPPLQLAKQVVDGLVRSLEPGDRFELLAFASDLKRLTDGLQDVDAGTTAEALRALHKLKADGATEMLHAIGQALESLREDSQRQVVLVTDGYIGFEAEVVGRIARGLPRGIRVHAVGIGAAPNRTLLQGVARAGRGVELLVGDEPTAIEAAKRLVAATARPVLTDLAIAGSAVVRCAPERPRDVFAGQPLVATVELRGEGGALEVTGRLAGASGPWKASVEVPALGAGGGPESTPLPIGALHGREAIADLELELAGGREAQGVRAGIERRGMRHRIASRCTSLVAIAEEPSVDPRQPRRRERLSVELPAGISAEGVGLVGLMYRASGGTVYEDGSAMLARPWSMKSIPRPAGAPARRVMQSVPGSRAFSIAATLAGRAADGTVTVEFEVPEDGFLLPEGRMSLHSQEGDVGVEVVVELSSPRGPHPRGVLVRLALRPRQGSRWPAAGDVTLRCSYQQPLPEGGDTVVKLTLHTTLPPEEKEPART
jgi:Ca-activated chloride channel homolog